MRSFCHDHTFLCLYRSVELYDTSEDKWSRGIPMPNRESFAGCAVLQSEVALLGGGLHGRSMTLYNPTAQCWRTAGAPHTPHLHSAVASMQDSLFVLVSSSAVILWSALKSLHSCLHQVHCLAISGCDICRINCSAGACCQHNMLSTLYILQPLLTHCCTWTVCTVLSKVTGYNAPSLLG